LIWIQTGINGVLALALDNRVGVKGNEVYATKVKRVVCRAKAITEESARIWIIQGDVMVARAGMKRHVELFYTVEIGWAGVGVETHVTHVPYKGGPERIDLGNRLTEFGHSELAFFDMNVSDECNVEVVSIPRAGPRRGRHPAACAQAGQH